MKKGVDVTVFTTNANGPTNLNVPTDSELLLDGVKVHYFPVQKPRSYFFSLSLSKALKRQIRTFDIVHINWLYVHPTMAAARECFRQGVPYLLAPRGMLDSNAIAMKGSLKKRLYLNLIEREHLTRAERVHFTSDGERNGAISVKWQVQPVIVSNGLDFEQLDQPHDSTLFYKRFPEVAGKKLALCLGRLNYIKGLDLMAKAWPSVVQAVPESHLVLVGPDENGYSKKIRRWLYEGGVGDSVTLTGLLLGEEKNAALKAADVFVASSHLESFGMAIVEAMAFRKAVVVTDRVNISFYIKKAKAGLVVPCDASKLSEAIISLMKNPQERVAMGERGLRLVREKYTWDRAAEEMLQVYRTVLANGNQP